MFATWLTGSEKNAEKFLAKALHNTNIENLSHLSCIEKLRKIYRFHNEKPFALHSNLPHDRPKTSIVSQIAALPIDSRVALGLQTVLNKSPEDIAFIIGQNITHVRQDLASSRSLLLKYNS
jgi:DNA-directed RNA polymerase specialized sigma24 family protein